MVVLLICRFINDDARRILIFLGVSSGSSRTAAFDDDLFEAHGIKKIIRQRNVVPVNLIAVERNDDVRILFGVARNLILIDRSFADEQAVFVDIRTIGSGINTKENLRIGIFDDFIERTKRLCRNMLRFSSEFFLLRHGLLHRAVGFLEVRYTQNEEGQRDHQKTSQKDGKKTRAPSDTGYG